MISFEKNRLIDCIFWEVQNKTFSAYIKIIYELYIAVINISNKSNTDYRADDTPRD